MIRRALIVLLAVFGLSCVPAGASQLTVSSQALTTFRSCVLTPVTSSSTVALDSSVDQNVPNTNQGTATSLTVKSHSSRNVRTYVRFDLTRCAPAIPSTATVTSSTLRAIPSALANQCRTYDVFRVNSSWVETSVTWNNQPFGTSINNPPTASRTSSINVGTAPCQNSTINQYVSGWNVTTDVQAFMTGTANNGWMIRDDVENSGTARTSIFYAKNANTIAAPQLIVNYAT